MRTDKPRHLGIFAFFETLPEPRVERTRRHPLMSVLIIALLTMICVGEGWEDMEAFGLAKEAWLRTFLDLPFGIPSEDTFRRVLSALNPRAFNACFIAWAQALSQGTSGKLIPIDGKTVRHSFDRATGKKALHVVSAWIADNRLTLGQIVTEEKSNEITAIPKLLELLDIRGATITIDAMGCQKDIARDIVTGGGDFVIAVKDNQPKLSEAIGALVMKHLEGELAALRHRSYETKEHGHGRRDERFYFVAQVPSDFALRKEWPWIKAIGTAVRITTHADGTQSDEVRYYMLSRFLSGKRFGAAVRAHWGIESMHWVLDVNFREDDSRTRERTLGNNLSWLRRFAVSLLKRHSVKDSLRGKMLRCMMNTDFLTEVLTIQGH